MSGKKVRKQKKDTWKELIDYTENTMTADGFDEAVIGTVEQFGAVETIVLYDKEKVIEMLMELYENLILKKNKDDES